MDEVINIIQLSPDRWKEYRYLRLEALQKDPQAFGQQYNKAINFPDSYWIDHLENTLNENKLLVFFAERDNELVGMIGAYFNSDIETENTARLFSVYVKRLFRNKGVARKLQRTLLQKLKGIEGVKRLKYK